MSTKLVRVALAAAALGIALPASASIGKWFKNEVVPTVTGKRPLKIDPKRVKITDKGKRILDLDVDKDTLFIQLGDVKFKTGELKKDLLRAGAVMAGDTAVMSQIAAEQLRQKLEEAQKQGGITIATEPPPRPQIVPLPGTTQVSKLREVTIYNATTVPIRYGLNDELFTLGGESGFKHNSGTGEFFLQYDNAPGEEVHIAFYYLTGREYLISYDEESNTLAIQKIR